MLGKQPPYVEVCNAQDMKYNTSPAGPDRSGGAPPPDLVRSAGRLRTGPGRVNQLSRVKNPMGAYLKPFYRLQLKGVVS